MWVSNKPNVDVWDAQMNYLSLSFDTQIYQKQNAIQVKLQLHLTLRKQTF